MSSPAGMPGPLRRLAVAFLRLYPEELRARHGDEMLDVVARRWRRRRAGTLAAGLGLVGFLCRDVVSAWRSRRRRRGPPASARLRTAAGSLAQDLRYGLRGLRRAPGFTVTAVLTLALGIGANAAIFSVVDAVLLEPLPYPRADRIHRLMATSWHSARQVEALREASESFGAITPVGQATLALRTEGAVERLAGSVVGADYFRVLGVRPARGRGFRDVDSRPGALPVAILSHELWSRSFGADPAIIGRQIELEGEGSDAHTVVGVLPPGHDPFVWRAHVLTPVRLDAGTHAYRDNHRYWIFGRLAPEATASEAAVELRGLVERLSAGDDPAFARDDVGRAEIASLHDTRVRDAGSTLLLMLAAVGVVLLIACVNVTNLLLARAGVREREMAVRSALGAGRLRILRQLLTESLLLALLGAGAGLCLAWPGTGSLARLLPTAIPRQADVRLDGSVLLFTLGISIAGGLLFGLLPALRTGRRPGAALRGSGRRDGGGSRVRLHGFLVASEIGLAVVLLVAAALLGKSLWRLHGVDPGFEPEGVVTMRLSPSEDRYPEGEARAGYYRAVLERVRALPGVLEAGAISSPPVSSEVMGVGISPDGNPVPEGRAAKIVSYRTVTPGALEALRARLLEGRLPGPADGLGTAATGLVNRRLADEMWPGESAVGRQLVWSTGDPWLTVVGVIEDIHQGSLAKAPEPTVYAPYAQQGTWLASLHVVARHEPGVDVLAAVRGAAREVDEQVPITDPGRLTDRVRDSMAGERGWALLFGAFAALAMVLAAVGVFGVMSYVVARRRREVGVRIALGARPGDVVRAVLRAGVGPLMAGLLVGAAGAAAAGSLLESLLYGVAPTDPSVIAGAVVFLGAVALLANLAPALRAARMDPLRALRTE